YDTMQRPTLPLLLEYTATNDSYTLSLHDALPIYDAKTKKRVKPMVNGKAWEYEILLDENHQLKRTLNIVNVPYTIVLFNGKVIYEHSNYTPGAENEMYKVIKEHVK